jgi:hypothetical protein
MALLVHTSSDSDIGTAAPARALDDHATARPQAGRPTTKERRLNELLAGMGWF